MKPRHVAEALWTAVAFTSYVGMSLLAGHRGRKSISPFEPMPELGVAVLAFALLVLAPAAVVVPRRRRIGQWLGIVPPDPPSGGGPDQDLRTRRPGGKPR